jgi:methionyl-tRNA formyltransferase
MNILFFGTPEFAAIHLQALIDAHIKITAVFTQPDKPAGRGQQLKASPVKKIAEQYHIPVYQPETLKATEIQEQIRAMNPDIIIDVAFGLMVSKAIIDLPKYGIINVHPSLLPRWRGASPIQAPILSGDKETGVTIMKMDEGLDTGPILLQEKCEIGEKESADRLHDRLAKIGSRLLIEALENIDRLKPMAQNDAESTYAKKIKKEDAEIDWALPAATLERMIRAYYSWPIAFSAIDGEMVKILAAEVPGTFSTQKVPGTFVGFDKTGIDVATGDGVLRITKMQFPGGKPLLAKDILNSKKSVFEKHKSFGRVRG